MTNEVYISVKLRDKLLMDSVKRVNVTWNLYLKKDKNG